MNHIETQLRQFKRKYWLAKLLQGLLIFCGTGLVFFALAALVEYVSWFSTGQRTLLFFSLAVVEVTLLLYYLGWPLAQFLIAGNALSDRKAAQIIGKNLSGIDDRLVNYLEMREHQNTSDLLDAGLVQKQESLGKYSFKEALSFSTLKPFLLFLIPVVLLVSFLFMGNNWFMLKEGTNRLVNYNVAFERTLPFNIQIEDDLVVDEGEDYQLVFTVDGDILPEQLTLESSEGSVQLNRKSGNTFSYNFTSCFKDVLFNVVYDDIASESYKLAVKKKAVIGRISITVTPPAYTLIEPFQIDNRSTIEVPQYSQVEIGYVFKNTDHIEIISSINEKPSTILSGEKLNLKINSDQELTASVSDQELNRMVFNVVADNRPIINVVADSVQEGLAFKINAFDDYGIKAAKFEVLKDGEVKNSVAIPHNGTTLKSGLILTWLDVETLDEATITVKDQNKRSIQRIDLKQYHEKEYSKEELMNDAGKSIDDVKEALNEENQEKIPGQSNEELKKKTSEINKKAKELSKKDSANYQRFEQLSEEIMKMVEEMDKDIPETRKKMKEEQLEEKIKQLEKEWMVLKNIENLKQMEDSLKMKDGAIDEKQMEDLQKEAKELENLLKKEQEEDKVDWKKFEELEKKNKQLDEESKNSAEEKNQDNKPEEKKEDTKGDQNAKEKESEDQDSDSDQKDGEQKDGEQKPNDSQQQMKQEMQNNSEELRKQLGQMSDMMMMEATQQNIELLRRLELRALKTSKKQEEVFLETIDQNEVDRQVMVSQMEVINSSKQVLDSLSALTVSNPELGQVLTEYQNRLDEHLVAMNEEDPANQRSFSSSQRYLQYGLNDLAAILYDILKSEQQNMMNMKAGNKQCNNPKPGNGKKPSMSKQQKGLGKKMGNMKKKGKGKGEGKQSYSQSELLELIKGQEAVIEQYEQESKGSKAGGDAKLAEDLNKQLDDLIRGDVDKALNRNKDIEDKLITFEESENKKKEQEEKRQSKENDLDYDAIKRDVVQDYLKENQRDSRIVNLPALKNYFTGKWISINQK